MPHYRLRIIGLVQGVFYRQSLCDQARQLGISGLVRNEPDGSVYAEIEGPEEDLRTLIAWAWEGPQQARVERVEVEEGRERGYGGFHVHRSA